MTLHACVHLFQDGEVRGALRDLVDIDGLLRHYGQVRTFWPALCDEAEALGLQRPAFYAIGAAVRILDTPIPAEVSARTRRWAPPALVDGVMTRLLDVTLSQGYDAPAVAQLALYVRSHWLRMPPWQLAGHLLRKAARRTAN